MRVYLNFQSLLLRQEKRERKRRYALRFITCCCLCLFSPIYCIYYSEIGEVKAVHRAHETSQAAYKFSWDRMSEIDATVAHCGAPISFCSWVPFKIDHRINIPSPRHENIIKWRKKYRACHGNPCHTSGCRILSHTHPLSRPFFGYALTLLHFGASQPYTVRRIATYSW